MNHVLDYTVQELNKLAEYALVFLYYKHPALGEFFDRINPFP